MTRKLWVVYVALVCALVHNANGALLEPPSMATKDEGRRGRDLKQVLAPVRYSMIGFSDALYELGEALIDLSLIRPQYRWVDVLNARAERMRAEEDYVATDEEYAASEEYDHQDSQA
jgi:hypothetical protein